MSDQRDDYYYDSFGRPHRITGGVNPAGTFSNMGQGGRHTVLPSLSAALQTSRPSAPNQYYYTQYGQQPSGRNDYSNASYGQTGWPSNTSQQYQASSYSQYPQYDSRHASQPVYSSYQSRSSIGLPVDPNNNSLRLPPLNIPNIPTPTGREDRTQNPSYSTATAHHSTHPSTHYPSHQTAASIRSPAASYPDPYAHYSPYQSQTQAADARYISQSMNSQSQRTPNPPPPRISSAGRGAPARTESHAYTPYPRAPPLAQSTSYMPEPETPTVEPMIKKKRKRADAAQLKVLNEVYQRTAFPSTEERQELARKLDMSARSVQIWLVMCFLFALRKVTVDVRHRFQNKRQAMRQSSRQAASSPSSTHPETQTSQQTAVLEVPISPVGAYSSSPTPPTPPLSRHGHNPSYISRSSEGYHNLGRSTQSPPASSHRRARTQEEESEARKWAPRGY
ncbi:hypothetical protein JAAARDRAFT_49688 [Jaapia argillacea MUCL 33604]|uniref:Homeobox domain-containing protein n=1 Tax=Jaapia argillacea MUCL 33604 TaxID=933084 RepID=A0A067PI29_9AGAM|nr:hypothetical protein JAAARDRAFT_49688 [Jaapia argillacea MUCL 33604]